MQSLRIRRPRKAARFFMITAELAVVGLASVVAIATNQWRERGATRLARLLQRRSETVPTALDEQALGSLPAPVARYFRTVLGDDPRMIRSAKISQRGTFLMRPEPPLWRKFYATHHVSTSPIGFLWDASIRLIPGLSVLVRDSFIDGIGSMRANVMGIWSLVEVEGTPEIAAGALHRYLAEAPWIPTTLLPSQGVTWTPIDETTARATITVGTTSVSADFSFAPDGTVSRVYTEARWRDVDGVAVPTPWQGHFSHYAEMHGVKIPLHAEVEWLLDEGPQPYWRGEITSIAYEY